jgi:hypothetical protein
MKLDKKQVPQLVVLGVLVLICIGYVSFKVVSPAPRRAPAAQTKTTDTVKVETSEDVSEDIARLLPNGVFPDLSITPARRDPFAPVSLPAASVEKPNQAASVTPSRTASQVVPNPTARVPRIEANPFNPFNSRSVSAARVEVQEEAPEFTITGVVRGERDVAIILTGEGGRYIVKKGQLIGGRYKVESVSDDGATLVYKNRRIYVKLGGVKNAS